MLNTPLLMVSLLTAPKAVEGASRGQVDLMKDEGGERSAFVRSAGRDSVSPCQMRVCRSRPDQPGGRLGYFQQACYQRKPSNDGLQCNGYRENQRNIND